MQAGKRRGAIATRQEELSDEDEVAEAETSMMSEGSALPSPKRKSRTGGMTSPYERFNERETPKKPTTANEVKKRLSMGHVDTRPPGAASSRIAQ